MFSQLLWPISIVFRLLIMNATAGRYIWGLGIIPKSHLKFWWRRLVHFPARRWVAVPICCWGIDIAISGNPSRNWGKKLWSQFCLSYWHLMLQTWSMLRHTHIIRKYSFMVWDSTIVYMLCNVQNSSVRMSLMTGPSLSCHIWRMGMLGTMFELILIVTEYK